MRNTIFRLTILALCLVLFSISFPALAATHTVPVGGNIQTLINDVSVVNGDTIIIPAGTYNQNITINKQLIIEGEGATTIISNAGNIITFVAGSSGSTVRNLTVQGGTAGIHFNANTTVNNVTIENVLSTNNTSYGLNIGSTQTNGLTIRNSTFSHNNVGFRVATQSTANDLLVEDSHFDNNNQGFVVYTAFANPPAVQSTFNNPTIRRSTFNNNLVKGLYIEKISDALFDEIEIDSSGTDPASNNNAGFEINSKFQSFSNVTIQNSTVTNSGHAPNPALATGGAISIKARNDAPSYNTNPSAIDDIKIINTQVVNNPAIGIRIGEPGKDNDSTTNVVIENSRIAGNAGGGLVNETTEAVVADDNWWGCAAGPGNPGCDTVGSTTPTGTVSAVNPITLTPTITADNCALTLDFTSTGADNDWIDSWTINLGITDGTIPANITPVNGVATASFTAPAGAPVTITVNFSVDSETHNFPVSAICGTTPQTPQPQPETAQPSAPSFNASDFIVVTGQTSAAAIGETVNITLTIKNPTGGDIQNATVHSALDSRLGNIRVIDSVGNATVTNNTLNITNISLSAGATAVIQLQVTLNQTAQAGDVIVIVASLSYNPTYVSDPIEIFVLPSRLPATGETPLWAELLNGLLNR